MAKPPAWDGKGPWRPEIGLEFRGGNQIRQGSAPYNDAERAYLTAINSVPFLCPGRREATAPPLGAPGRKTRGSLRAKGSLAERGRASRLSGDATSGSWVSRSPGIPGASGQRPFSL